MGMFDTLRCHYPLPDPELQANEFQTKSLDSLLEHYTITRAGRLVYHAERREPQEDDRVPWGFRLALVDAWDEDTGFHGDLEFYDYVDGVLYTYRARFNEGQLVNLERVPERVWNPRDPAASDRSRRYAEVFKRAVAVFGNVDTARGWLWEPSTMLSGQTPLAAAATEAGAAQVQALLDGVARAEG